MAMFKQWDVNSNGALSLSEVDSAMRRLMGNTLGPKVLSNTLLRWDRAWKPVIMRAYNHCRNSNRFVKAKKNRNDDYVEVDEFRLLLVCIRQYFEMYVAFTRLDANEDKRIDLSEFKLALPTLLKWGITVPEDEAESTFKAIDENRGGFILFDEFIRWALERDLDLDDDDDFDAFDMEEGEKVY